MKDLEKLRQTGMTVEEENEMEYLFYPRTSQEAIEYLAKVREEIDSLSFVRVLWMMPLLHLQEERFANVSFIETEFYLIFLVIVREYFSHYWGGIDFLPPLYHFLQKNLTDSWSQLPDNTNLLNNWLMGGTLAVTGITTSFTALTQMVQDRENQVDQDLFLTDLGSWGLQASHLISSIIISLSCRYLCLLL